MGLDDVVSSTVDVGASPARTLTLVTTWSARADHHASGPPAAVYAVVNDPLSPDVRPRLAIEVDVRRTVEILEAVGASRVESRARQVVGEPGRRRNQVASHPGHAGLAAQRPSARLVRMRAHHDPGPPMGRGRIGADHLFVQRDEAGRCPSADPMPGRHDVGVEAGAVGRDDALHQLGVHHVVGARLAGDDDRRGERPGHQFDEGDEPIALPADRHVIARLTVAPIEGSDAAAGGSSRRRRHAMTAASQPLTRLPRTVSAPASAVITATAAASQLSSRWTRSTTTAGMSAAAQARWPVVTRTPNAGDGSVIGATGHERSARRRQGRRRDPRRSPRPC